MLPGEAHAAQDLDAALGALDIGVEREGPGQHGRQLGLGGVTGVGGLGGVPRQRGDLLDGDQHVGQAVLHGLDLPDGPAELAALDGVGRVPTSRHPGRRPPPAALGRGDAPGRGPAPWRSTPRATGVRGPPPRPPPAPSPPDGWGRGWPSGPAVTTPAPSRSMHAPHDCPTLDAASPSTQPGPWPATATGASSRRASVAPSTSGPTSPATSSDPSLGARARRGSRPRKDHRGGDGAVGHGGQGAPCAARRRRRPGHHRRGQHRRDGGPGHHGARHLFDDHSQLEHAEALSAVLFGHVDPQPTLAGQLVPEGRHGLGLGVEQGAGHPGRAARLEPPSHRATQLLVVLPDADGHALLPCPACLVLLRTPVLLCRAVRQNQPMRWSSDQTCPPCRPSTTTAASTIIRFCPCSAQSWIMSTK